MVNVLSNREGICERQVPSLLIQHTRLGTECFVNGYRATVEKKTITAIPEGQVKKVEVLVTAAK